MISFKPVVVALVASTSILSAAADGGGSVRARRRLATFESIAGYEPLSLVTDHNALDLDVRAMEKQLKAGNWSEAHSIYKEGAYGKIYAELTLTEPLDTKIPANTKVTGKSQSGGTAVGYTMRESEIGESQLEVQYVVSPNQESYVNCQVGALWRIHSANLDGCFQQHNGTIEIEDHGNYDYEYDVRIDNKAARTLKTMSVTAERDMMRCEGCPYQTFQKFNDYYGEPKYANDFVTAAFHGESTSFTNGNIDFTDISNSSRAEAIQKGAVGLNVWMGVIRKMNDAVTECEQGSNRPKTLSWDEAVAFYTGSLEGSDGKDEGKLLHQLADDRCANFHTCGADAHKASGHAKVNHEIFQHFKLGQRNLLEGNCEKARANKELIENRMVIPMIQGTLRYAHINGNPLTANEKALSEGATFAAAVLPLVHACDANAAAVIHENLSYGKDTSYDLVRWALESTYDCLQVSCADVGGYYDKAAGEYFKGAEPCTGGGSGSVSSSKEGGANALGVAIGVTLVAVCVIGGAVLVARRRQQKEPAPVKKNPIFVTPEEPFT